VKIRERAGALRRFSRSGGRARRVPARAARGHLEAAFARMLEALHDSGSLDQKGLKSLESGRARCDRGADRQRALGVRVENDGHFRRDDE